MLFRSVKWCEKPYKKYIRALVNDVFLEVMLVFQNRRRKPARLDIFFKCSLGYCFYKIGIDIRWERPIHWARRNELASAAKTGIPRHLSFVRQFGFNRFGRCEC